MSIYLLSGMGVTVALLVIMYTIRYVRNKTSPPRNDFLIYSPEEKAFLRIDVKGSPADSALTDRLRIDLLEAWAPNVRVIRNGDTIHSDQDVEGRVSMENSPQSFEANVDMGDQTAPRSRVRLAPGTHAMRLMDIFHSRKTFERVFEPMWRDYLDEYADALQQKRPSKARIIRVRYTIRFVTIHAAMAVKAIHALLGIPGPRFGSN